MEFLRDHSDAGAALSAFLMDPDGAAKLPDATRDLVVKASGKPSPFDRAIDTIEALYSAAPSDLNAKARMIGAQLAAFAAASGWNDPARLRAIAFSFMRRSNIVPPLGITYQAAEDDPEPIVVAPSQALPVSAP